MDAPLPPMSTFTGACFALGCLLLGAAIGVAITDRWFRARLRGVQQILIDDDWSQ